MTRSTRALLAALTTAAAAAGGFADSEGYSQTITVPGDFKTVQAAINAANGGDVIVVSGGVYHENLVVSGRSREGLQIYANEGAKIVGTNGTPAISVATSHVGLHGFVVESSGDGVVVSRAADVFVDGTYVADTGGDAFRVVDSYAVSFSSNVVDVAGGAGFRVTGSNFVTIDANDVGGAADGVVVAGSSSVSVCSNSFEGIDGTAVTADDSRDLVLDENYLRDVGDTGFDVQGTAGVYMGANTMVDDGGASPLTGDGIRVVGSTGVDLNQNTIEGALGHGVNVDDAPDAELWSTTIAGVGGDAVHFGVGATGAHVTDSTIDGAGGSGIVVLADDAMVQGNHVQDAGADGVQVRGENAYVGGNTVESAGHDGLSVTGSVEEAAPTVEFNRVWASGHDGLDLGATCGAQVTANTIQHSRVYGIELGAGDDNVLSQNRASKNRSFDLYESDSAHDNTIDKTNKFKRAHRRGGKAHKHKRRK